MPAVPANLVQPFIDVQIVPHPVRLDDLMPFPPDAGAECVFLGRTRLESNATHGRLIRLEYEAHETMAQAVLERLARTGIERFGSRAVRVHHATGPVAVGDASVLVQVAAGHRAEAFEACRYLIDALKQDAPIWKREIWEGGHSWAKGTVVTPTEEDR